MSEAHSNNLAHHFETMEQQKQASSLGMWLFLVQEVMFFGGLFLGYVVYRSMYHDAFIAGSHLLNVKLGAFNTVVLIGSSLTIAFSVRAGQLGRNRQILGWLAATLVLGAVFLGVKGVEYAHKYHEHLMPGPHFHYDAAQHSAGAHVDTEAVDPHKVELFVSFYFAMTGLHATHMIIGIGLIVWLMVKAARRRFSSDYYAPVEVFGLYWHFVDIVWIFLFPLLYLIGRH
ncbi:MAG: cytochrome c oxidase subunit 3 family protein [Verrucomicrobia bacterium]|nr:cytochrome c oxidase subunit 3 family protein [Verrucomicrobiota bacterium]